MTEPPRYWWRFLLAAVLIVATSAGATAAAGLGYFEPPPRLPGLPPLPEPRGEPQTILLLGSDKRSGEEGEGEWGRSDTAMLVRIDPGRRVIAVMSIPRDLSVEIPGVGTDKFNAAYAYGGPALTLRTLTKLTRLEINHVVNVNFLGFAQAVYAIGCVYADVDRRYYHSNEGVPPSEQYAEINVKPGYQLMCGKQALDYVRYRHTDTDIVRSARQQGFLAAARQRVSVADLALDRDGLIEIFGEYTSSDIEDRSAMIRLARLLLAARNAQVQEVAFPVELGPSYVYASSQGVATAVAEFLGTSPEGDPGDNRSSPEAASKKQRQRERAKKKKVVISSKPGSDELVPAGEAGAEEAAIAARRMHEPFPVYYPTRLPPGTDYEESNPYEKVVDPYVYRIRDGTEEDAERFQAYRMVLVREASDGVHYFGVQGIRGWEVPPILEDPTETITVGGREFDIYADGGRIKLIAWHRGENSYWIANDLLKSLSNEQMVGMARSLEVTVPRAQRRP